MEVTVRRAASDERDLLSGLLAAYLFEFDEFDGQVAPYEYFDLYWVDSDRLPFLVEAGGRVAGFCLVRLRGLDWTIAEFSVVPEARRNGIGRRAVAALLERAADAGAGYVEASVHPGKDEALAFWLACEFRVIDEGDPIITRHDLSH